VTSVTLNCDDYHIGGVLMRLPEGEMHLPFWGYLEFNLDHWFYDYLQTNIPDRYSSQSQVITHQAARQWQRWM
jgi:hypothetical protein